MNSAFPLTGQLEKLECGHSFLNRYAGNLTVEQGAGSLDGKAMVHLDALAAEGVRQDGSAVRQAFGAALKVHLSPRLGSLYAEFEQRIAAPRVFANNSKPLSCDEIAAFSTVAREVIHYADAHSEIEALRKRSVDAFEAVRERPSAAAEDLGARCVQCVNRGVLTDIHAVSGPIIANAPQVYRVLLARQLAAAIADVGRAKERATGQVAISIPDAGRREEQDQQRTPFMRSSSAHVEATDSDGDDVAAPAESNPSLFQRFFGDCFSDRAERQHAE